MSARHIWIILKKEIKDMARDKKTIITSLLVPFIIIPLMNILVGGGVESLNRDINENVTISMSQNSNTEDIKKLVRNEIIKDFPNIRLVEDMKDPVEAVRKGDVRVVLEFEKDYVKKLESKKPFTIKLLFDQSKTKSEASIGIVSSAIEKFNAKVVENRLKELNLDTDILKPMNIEQKNVADKKNSGNAMLSMLLPMFLVMFIASGGIPAATDLVAGEKERNTFEPLLTTRPKRLSILIGKYLTVTLFSFITVLASVAGLVISYIIKPTSLTMGAGDQVAGIGVPVGALVMTLLIAITLGLIFAGIQTALSTYAKSFKEAQTYMGFLTIIVILPAYATMFMQASEIPTYMFVVPILNTIAAIKMVLGGAVVYSNLALALGSSVVYMAATSIFAAWMFTKEKVLFRS